jgi:NAD dependent epimerase/dehydratase family enzyme
VSLLYADGGDDWITEASPLAVTHAVEPSAVAESNAADFESPSRTAVVLRFGQLIGDDGMTRWRLAQAQSGRPIGMGDPRGWAHVVHPDDAGSAVACAVTAPSGVYNVGADPVQRHDLVQGYADAAGVESAAFMGPVVRWFAGKRIEPLSRSLRVSSDHFASQTGWRARHPKFDSAWLDRAIVLSR